MPCELLSQQRHAKNGHYSSSFNGGRALDAWPVVLIAARSGVRLRFAAPLDQTGAGSGVTLRCCPICPTPMRVTPQILHAEVDATASSLEKARQGR